MASRRLSSRVKIGFMLAGVALGGWVTATPVVGQQNRGGGGGAKPVGSIPVGSVQVPTITVPGIAVPRIPVPGQPVVPQQPPARYLSPQRLEGFAQAARLGLNYLPGEVIVKFKPGTAKADQDHALASIASQPTADALEWHSDFAVVYDASQPNAYLLADQLKSQPEVEYAEPNFIATVDPSEKAYAQMHPAPVPTLVPRPVRQSGGGRIAATPTDTDYLGFQWNFALLNMPNAWDLQPGGSSDIIVAVIDTGITGTATTLTYPIWTGSGFQTLSMPTAVNPDLPASRQVLPRDFVGSQVSPAPPLVDLDGHGTHVSGTIGEATNNGLLVAGIAYNVRIMPVKVCAQYWDVMIARGLTSTTGFAPASETGCAYSDMADGVRYAVDNGARVMNISIGGTAPSTTMQSALIYAAGKGAFISISMGNNFTSVNPPNPTMYPAAYASSIDGVMSVAAVDVNSNHASYSSSGSYCEIAAPGGDLSTGGGRVDGGAIWQSTLRIGDVSSGLLVPRFDRYDKQGYTGTSMAAPHVAGLAALILSQNPGLTGAQVEQAIKASAKDIGVAGKDDLYGYGLIQPRAALFGQSIR